MRYQEISEIERHKPESCGGYKIRPQESPKTYSAAQYRYNLTVGSHFGCEKYDCNKCEEVAEKINEKRDKIHII
jgi:hypothetical protein